MWQVVFTKKSTKQSQKLNLRLQELVFALVKELRLLGPIRGNWLNFSKLSSGGFHCHIKKGKPTYVVCWRVEDKKNKIIRIYYVGTHEKAPY